MNDEKWCMLVFVPDNNNRRKSRLGRERNNWYLARFLSGWWIFVGFKICWLHVTHCISFTFIRIRSAIGSKFLIHADVSISIACVNLNLVFFSSQLFFWFLYVAVCGLNSSIWTARVCTFCEFRFFLFSILFLHLSLYLHISFSLLRAPTSQKEAENVLHRIAKKVSMRGRERVAMLFGRARRWIAFHYNKARAEREIGSRHGGEETV